jgi:hypothetical protein
MSASIAADTRPTVRRQPASVHSFETPLTQPASAAGSYLRGIDNTEIIQAVHERPAPMVPASSRASLRR